MSDTTEDPDLEEVMDLVLKQTSADIKVMWPGRVETYDETTQTATVKPLLLDAFENEDGVTSFELPVLPNVPVVFSRAGDAFQSFPLKPGHYVQLEFLDRSIDAWARGDGSVTDPVDMRRHSMADAIAKVGFYPDQDALADVHADNIVTGFDGGAQIHVKADEVDLYEENASDFVALAALVKTEIEAVQSTLDSLVTAYNAHVHITTATVSAGAPGTIAATTSTATPPSSVADVAATKVKAT